MAGLTKPLSDPRSIQRTQHDDQDVVACPEPQLIVFVFVHPLSPAEPQHTPFVVLVAVEEHVLLIGRILTPHVVFLGLRQREVACVRAMVIVGLLA